MYITEVLTKSSTGKVSHRCILLRTSFRKDGKVRNKTLLNLTHCDPEQIDAFRWALKNKKQLHQAAREQPGGQLKQGPSIGAVWAVLHAARELGIEQALGDTREGKLALWQVMARVIAQGSRLSAVRLAQEHAACEVLGLRAGFDENDLYDNLKWISARQQAIEDSLFQSRYGQDARPGLYLYDVTSTYLEGQHNALAAFGYNRDKKAGKRQLVLGLLCDEQGEAVSIEVFKGNTIDTQTMSSQIAKVAGRFGGGAVTLVGDRGMIKSPQRAELGKHHMHYITALAKPQIEKLLRNKVLQMELFDEPLAHIHDQEAGVRYVLRRNPQRAGQVRENRRDRQNRFQAWIDARNLYLQQHPKAKAECALAQACARVQKLKLAPWASVAIKERTLYLEVDTEALAEEEKLDGCYVLITDLKPEAASAKLIHDRYKDLAQVEQAFRTSKTVHLEMRPVHVRRESSTRAHALVVMLAYRIIRHLQRAWEPFDMTAEEGLEILAQYCTLEQKDTPSCLFCLLQPRDSVAKLLDALKATLPDFLPKTNAHVVTRKKLKRKTKTVKS